jgi:phage tail-like protein
MEQTMTQMKTALDSIDGIRAVTNPAFRFIVNIEGMTHGVFTECTLPVIEWEVEEVKEGGVNNYVHQLPGRRKSTRLTLKNGVGSGALADWFFQKSLAGAIERHTVTVSLLNAKEKADQPVMSWTMVQAYPIKWTGPQLNAGENSIAIQTLEFACGEITVSE